jgi:hypothetical protein
MDSRPGAYAPSRNDDPLDVIGIDCLATELGLGPWPVAYLASSHVTAGPNAAAATTNAAATKSNQFRRRP